MGIKKFFLFFLIVSGLFPNLLFAKKANLKGSFFLEGFGNYTAARTLNLSSTPQGYSLISEGTKTYWIYGGGIGINLGSSTLRGGAIAHSPMNAEGTVEDLSNSSYRYSYQRRLNAYGLYGGFEPSIYFGERMALRFSYEIRFMSWRLSQEYSPLGTTPGSPVTDKAEAKNVIHVANIAFEFIFTDNWSLGFKLGFMNGMIPELTRDGATTLFGNQYPNASILKDADGNHLNADFRAPIVGISLRTWYQ